MSYNLFCETNKIIQWEHLNSRVQSFTTAEYVPMPGMGIDGGDALGISIPLKNTGVKAWKEINEIIKILQTEFNFVIYDMYYGELVELNNMEKIKEAIT